MFRACRYRGLPPCWPLQFVSLLIVIVIGSVFGALDGVGIFFAREEPYKLQIFMAATLKGALVGVVTASFLTSSSPWWAGLAAGASCGFVFALVIYLCKGGWQSGDAPYVIPSGIITGTLIGLFIIIWGLKRY